MWRSEHIIHLQSRNPGASQLGSRTLSAGWVCAIKAGLMLHSHHVMCCKCKPTGKNTVLLSPLVARASCGNILKLQYVPTGVMDYVNNGGWEVTGVWCVDHNMSDAACYVKVWWMWLNWLLLFSCRMDQVCSTYTGPDQQPQHTAAAGANR